MQHVQNGLVFKALAEKREAVVVPECDPSSLITLQKERASDTRVTRPISPAWKFLSINNGLVFTVWKETLCQELNKTVFHMHNRMVNQSIWDIYSNSPSSILERMQFRGLDIKLYKYTMAPVNGWGKKVLSMELIWTECVS